MSLACIRLIHSQYFAKFRFSLLARSRNLDGADNDINAAVGFILLIKERRKSERDIAF